MSLRNVITDHRLKEREPANFFPSLKDGKFAYERRLPSHIQDCVHSTWVLVAKFDLLMVIVTNRERTSEWRCQKQIRKGLLNGWPTALVLSA